MADVETLKRLDAKLVDVSPNQLIQVPMVRSQLQAIIAALEDRDRLRAWVASDYLLAESFAEWAAQGRTAFHDLLSIIEQAVRYEKTQGCDGSVR